MRASSRLQAKVDAFRTRKETIKATYSAAEAQTRINEAFTGISEEMSDVGLAIQRAEDKTLQLQARASAVDELLASGALEDPSGMYKDDITRELDALASDNAVENELAAMKAQLTGAPAPRAELSAPVATVRRPRPRPPAGGDQAASAAQLARPGVPVMIVRIMGQGQWVLEPEHLMELNELDRALEDRVAAGDEPGMLEALKGLVEGVRARGIEVPEDVLAESDLVLPDVDVTLEEMRELLEEISEYYGLIPGRRRRAERVATRSPTELLRVVVASDALAGLSPAGASELIAAGVHGAWRSRWSSSHWAWRARHWPRRSPAAPAATLVSPVDAVELGRSPLPRPTATWWWISPAAGSTTSAGRLWTRSTPPVAALEGRGGGVGRVVGSAPRPRGQVPSGR